jgi:hypothetical protein
MICSIWDAQHTLQCPISTATLTFVYWIEMMMLKSGAARMMIAQ